MNSTPDNISVFAYSTSRHTAQAYTGLDYLEKSGELTVHWKNQRQGCEWLAPGGVGARSVHSLFLQTNEGDLVFLDFDDGNRINLEALKICKTYFKRSYRPSDVPDGYSHKVFPWGLHYEVNPDHFNFHELIRIAKYGGLCRASISDSFRFLEYLTGKKIVFGSQLRFMSSPARKSEVPTVLFSVRTWNPYAIGGDGQPLRKEVQEERTHLNEMRANCLRRLKGILKDRFIGGFSHTPHAIANYKDLLLPLKSTSDKGEYIKALSNSDICVATTGLHDSIGWKFGEYIAFGKAVVSESLRFSPSGPFLPGKNFLPFDNDEQCFEQVMRLVDSPTDRLEMMQRNTDYYQKWLHPGKMILRAIMISNSLPKGFGRAERSSLGPIV